MGERANLNPREPAARALLTFNDSGELRDIFLIGSSPHEEALAEKGVQNVLKPVWLIQLARLTGGRIV